MENLNKGFVFVAVFLATASLCDAGERGRWTESGDPRSVADMHLYHADNQEGATENITTTTMATTTATTTANPPPPSSSGYSLTYTHSTENGTVVVANDNSNSSNNNISNNSSNNNSSIARSRKKGELEEEPVEELPSLPDPPLHTEANDTSTTRSVVPKKGLDSPASLEADAASGNGQHHHSGRIVPKKGVEAGDEDDGGIRNEMATTSEAPSVTDRQYNATAGSEDNSGDGGLNRVIIVPEHVESPVPAPESVPHVAEVPEPILNDRGRGQQQQESKSDPPRDADPSTPDTSLVVGLIFAATLFSVIAFLVFKRVRSAQRRREYRRMNDFLIDGMYNDL